MPAVEAVATCMTTMMMTLTQYISFSGFDEVHLRTEHRVSSLDPFFSIHKNIKLYQGQCYMVILLTLLLLYIHS